MKFSNFSVTFFFITRFYYTLQWMEERHGRYDTSANSLIRATDHQGIASQTPELEVYRARAVGAKLTEVT